jgi:ketosteroid isomerase-like protein
MRALLALLAIWSLPTLAAAGESRARDDFAAGLAALAAGDMAAAEQRFLAVVQTDPAAHEAYNNLGVVYAEQGREEEAAARLREAVRLRGDYERARRNLAAVYVRLAAKELLVAAEQAEPAKRAALAAAARDLLLSGPKLVAPDLMARADALAVASVAVAPAGPAPGRASTPTTTSTLPPVTPTATVTTAISVAVAPVGVEILHVDGNGKRLALYRREEQGLAQLGEWRTSNRSPLGSAPTLLQIARRSDWRVRLADPHSGAITLLIEAEGVREASANAIVVKVADLRAATGTLVERRDAAIHGDAAVLVLDNAESTGLLRQVESWRRAWAGRKLAEYAEYYADDFRDERGRSRGDWLARKGEIFERSGEIEVQIEVISAFAIAETAATVIDQRYSSQLERSRGFKRLIWRREPSGWKIAREQADF